MEKNLTAKTWQIDTIDELKAFRDEVNAGNSFAGWTITLGADIDISGENWLPIGNVGNSFQGTFDGADHTITGLTIDNSRLAYAGFFGYVDSGSVQNVTFENVSINAGSYVGTVAGYTNADYSACEFENITVRGCVQITGGAAVGGIIGGGNATLNTVSVEVATEDDENYTEDSFILGTSGDVGGIAGRVTDDTREGDQFSNLTSNIDVKGQGTAVHSVGGIFGSAGDNVTVNDAACTAGNITADAVGEEYKDFVGGIVGNYGTGVTLSQVSPQIDAISGTYVQEADGVVVDNDRVNDNIFSGENKNVITVNYTGTFLLGAEGGDVELFNTRFTAASLSVASGRKLTLTNSDADFGDGELLIDGTLALSVVNSTIKGGELTLGDDARIVIDGTGFTEGCKKIVDLEGNSYLGNVDGSRIVFENLEDGIHSFYGQNGDIAISDADYTRVYLTGYSDDVAFGETLFGEKTYVGINIYNAADEAVFFADLASVNTFYIDGTYTTCNWLTKSVEQDMEFVKIEDAESASITFTGAGETVVTGDLTIGEGVTIDISGYDLVYGTAEGTAELTVDGAFTFADGSFTNASVSVAEEGTFNADALTLNGEVIFNGGTYDVETITLGAKAVLDIAADTVITGVINDLNNGTIALYNGADFTAQNEISINRIYVGRDYSAGADSTDSVFTVADGVKVTLTTLNARSGNEVVVNGIISADQVYLYGAETTVAESGTITVGGKGLQLLKEAELLVQGTLDWAGNSELTINAGTSVTFDGGDLLATGNAAVVNNGTLNVIGETTLQITDLQGAGVVNFTGATLSADSSFNSDSAEMVYVFDGDNTINADMTLASSYIEGATLSGATFQIGAELDKAATLTLADGVTLELSTYFGIGGEGEGFANHTLNLGNGSAVTLTDFNNLLVVKQSGIVTAAGGSISASEIKIAGIADLTEGASVTANQFNVYGEEGAESAAMNIVNSTVAVRDGLNVGHSTNNERTGVLLLDNATVEGGLTVNASGSVDVAAISQIAGDILNAGTVTITQGACLGADTLVNSGEGKVVFDAEGFTGFAKILDLNTEGISEGLVTLINGEGISFIYGADGDVTVTDGDLTVFTVDNTFSGEYGDQVGDKLYFGVNAFSSMDSAVEALTPVVNEINAAEKQNVALHVSVYTENPNGLVIDMGNNGVGMNKGGQIVDLATGTKAGVYSELLYNNGSFEIGENVTVKADIMRYVFAESLKIAGNVEVNGFYADDIDNIVISGTLAVESSMVFSTTLEEGLEVSGTLTADTLVSEYTSVALNVTGKGKVEVDEVQIGIVTVAEDATLTVNEKADVVSMDIAGSVNLTAGAVVKVDTLTGAGTLNLTCDDTLTLGTMTMTGEGTIVIDAATYEGGICKVIDVTGGTIIKDRVSIINLGENFYQHYAADGDVYLIDQDQKTIYVDSVNAEGVVANNTAAEGKALEGYNKFDTLLAASEAGVLVDGVTVDYGNAQRIYTASAMKTDGRTYFREAGTYTITGGEGAYLPYVALNGPDVVVNIKDAHLTMVQVSFNGSDTVSSENAQINITNTQLDAANGDGAGLAWLTAYGDTAMTITNSVVGLSDSFSGSIGDIAVGNAAASNVTDYLSSNNWYGRAYVHITGSLDMVKSTLFAAYGFNAVSGGTISLDDSVVYTSRIELGANSTITVTNGSSLRQAMWGGATYRTKIAGTLEVNEGGSFVYDLTGGTDDPWGGGNSLKPVNVLEGGQIKVTDGSMEISALDNAGTITLAGVTTVAIGTLTGKAIVAADGATLTDSTVGGTVEAQKNLNFAGNNTIKTLKAVNGGTITVEEGKTLALNNFSFGSSDTAGNKYIINGGTITANYGFFQHGTYTLNADFETGYMYYSYGSDITVNGSFHSRGEGDGLDYVRGKLTVAAGGESVHANALWIGQPASWGEMAASLTVAGYVQAGTLNVYNGSTMTVDGSGTVSAGTFNLTGTLTINAGDDFDGARKVVDVTGTAAEYDTEKITVNGAQLAIADDGDIFIHNADMSTFYVDAAYTGEFGDKVAKDQYLGINAFNSFAAALDSKVDKTTVKFVVNSDTDSALSNKTVTGTVVTGAEDGVTISDSANDNYVNFTGANIDKNITVDAKYFYLYGENTFACDVKSSTTFYSSGKLTLTGNAEVYTTMSRYYAKADDGIYVVGTAEAGKGAEAEVQFKANNYLGHYSGTFSVKDTAAEFGYILLNGDTDGDGYSSARLVLDNALIKTIGGPNTQPGQVLMNGDAAIIATNNSVLDFVGPEDFAYLSMGKDNTISLTDSEMRLGGEGQGSNIIDGAITLASSKLSSLGTINVGDTGSITTAASEKGGINVIFANKIVNKGTITVGGLTTLTAKNFAGNTIIIADGATLRDTEVLSDKYLELNITENDAYVDYVLSVNGDKAGTVYFQGKNFISSIDAGVRDTVVVKGETTSLHIGNDGFKLGNGANWIIGSGASVSADYYLSLDSVKDNTAKSTMLVENASLNVKGISAKGTTQPIGSGAFDVTFNKANVTLGNVGIRIQEQSPESADINITFKESKFTADVNDLKNDAANSEVTFEATDVNFTRTFRNNGTLNITNGSKVSAKNLYATGEHLSANSGTINVKNATLNLSEKVAFDNSGTINVEGESTLNIGILTGNAVNVLEGATLTKSVLGGESEVVLVGNATVKDSEIYAIGGMEGADGNVTMNIIGTDASQIIGTGPTPENVLNGDLTINVSGTECDIMTAGSRTYNGAVEFNITDNSNVAQLAIGLSANFTDVAVKVDNSSVGVISAGNAIQIADEYKVDLNNAQIGSFEFLNGVIADEITIAGTTAIEGALFGADLISVAEDSIISAASIDIGEGARMTVSSGAQVTTATVTNNGTLTVNALSTFTATDITRDGAIIIDAANFESGVKKIIDLTSTSLEGSVEVINLGDNNVFYGADGDVYITDQNRDTIYVGSKYAGEFGTAADDNRVIGYNAFDAFAENTDPAASAFWKGVSAVVLSAGNSESEIYGSSRLMPSEGVTEFSISTTGEGYALLDRLSLRSASEPVEVTIEEGSRIKTTLGGYVNPNFTLTVKGEVDVAASGSGVDFRVYPDGILNVAKGGKFVVSGGQFISTGTVNVYGAMEINGKEGDFYAKLAGDDAQHASNFNIDGGSLAINQKAFSIGGGWGWTWLPITNGENCKFTITNNGTFTSTASYFRISAAGILDISKGGSMTFTNEDAASANGVYCNKNEGTVQLNGGALDVSNLKEFTNAGAMQLTGDAKLTVGDDFINETEITLEDFTGSVSGTINGGSVVFEGKSTLASAADFTETLTQVSDDAQLVIAENGTLDAELINNSGVIDAQGGKIDAGCIQMQNGTWELGGFTASTEDREIEVSFIKEGDSILDGITFKVTLKAGETSISGEAFKGIFSDETANNYMTAGKYIVTAADKEYEYAVRGDMTIEQGSFKVTGKSELHIAEIKNGVIELHNGGEITDSSVEIGTVVVYGTTGKISGETSINILYVGYPDGYEIDSAAEVTITGSFNSTSNFVVGKFGTVNIGDAQGDRTTVNAKSASWINGSVVNLTNAGYSGTQALSMTGTVTLDNATVFNDWEGQMNVGNGSGKVTLKNNSSLEYTTYFYIGGYYETGEAVLEVTDSTVKGKWIRTSDKAVMTFNGSSLIATSSLSLKGELTLTDSLLDAASLVITESGKINADWDSAIEFDALTNDGAITFDMTGAEGCILKVMDYTGTGSMDLDAYGEVYAGELYNGFRVYNNDLYAVTADFSEKNVTLSTLWAGSDVYEQVDAGCIYGVNAVGSLNELAADVEKLTITGSEGDLGEFTFTHSDVALKIVNSDITADLTMTDADVTIAEGSTFAGTMTAAESIKLSGTGVINGTLSSDSGILTINDEITVNVIKGFTSITANAFEAGSISMTLGSDIFYANGNVTVETVDFMTGFNDILVIADGVSVKADIIESSGNLTISMGYADETTITVTDNGAFADNSNLVINLTSFTAGADGVLVSGITEFAGTVVYNGSQVKLGDKIFANGALYELAITEKGLGFAAVSGDYDIFSGDMDANKQSDILIFNANDNSLSAFLTAGDGDLSFSWGELGTLEEGAVILGTGKAYGTADSSQSIFYQIDGKIKACVVDNGVVTGTQDIYDIPENGAEIIGLGDFNNDGATDLLLAVPQSEDGGSAIGCIFSDSNSWNYFQSLGSEWDVTHVGDFNGDGRDDVVLEHGAGFAGAWLIKEDGTPEWAGLDSIANVETCGVGDFNGDGIDDVLVRNGEWVGAWIVGTDGDASNGLVDSFIGIKGDLAADASIEQIADFNKDGIDDIVVRTAAGDLGVLVVKGSESTEWNYTAKLTLA